jgi:hypothetical protein
MKLGTKLFKLFIESMLDTTYNPRFKPIAPRK